MPDTLVFTYFDFPALGEAVRLALAMSGKQWEDKRISFDDFKQLKPSKLFHSKSWYYYNIIVVREAVDYFV